MPSGSAGPVRVNPFLRLPNVTSSAAIDTRLTIAVVSSRTVVAAPSRDTMVSGLSTTIMSTPFGTASSPGPRPG